LINDDISYSSDIAVNVPSVDEYENMKQLLVRKMMMKLLLMSQQSEDEVFIMYKNHWSWMQGLTLTDAALQYKYRVLPGDSGAYPYGTAEAAGCWNTAAAGCMGGGRTGRPW